MDAPLGRLEGFVCSDYPKAMSCGSAEPEPESEPHGPYNPDHNGYNTGLATTDDPLVADFRHSIWLYKFGLFVFMTSSLAATLSTEPELEAARPKRFVLSAGAGWWSSAHVVLGVFSLLGALLVGIGAHGMFALSADDILYGNGKGGPAPLGPLQQCKPLSRAEPMHLWPRPIADLKSCVQMQDCSFWTTMSWHRAPTSIKVLRLRPMPPSQTTGPRAKAPPVPTTGSARVAFAFRSSVRGMAQSQMESVSSMSSRNSHPVRIYIPARGNMTTTTHWRAVLSSGRCGHLCALLPQDSSLCSGVTDSSIVPRYNLPSVLGPCCLEPVRGLRGRCFQKGGCPPKSNKIRCDQST